MDQWFHHTQWAHGFLSMLGLKLIHISNMDLSLCPQIEKHLCWRLAAWYCIPISGNTRLRLTSLNTLRPRRSRRHFADDSLRYIFLNENIWISIKISLKSIAKSPINNIPTLVQIMAWRRPGDKPLSEAMMVRLLTQLCIARPQWVNLRLETSTRRIVCWQRGD